MAGEKLYLNNVDNPGAAVKMNLSAIVAPAVTDDSASGYAVNSQWIDVTGDKAYVCVDASVGAAVWIETTGGGGASPLTTKGDLFGFSTVNARLPIGTNNQQLIADSAEALGVKWVTEIGTSEINITSGVTSGAAASGFLAATNNMVEYEIQGSGAGASKIIYYSVIVPQDYKSGGTVNVNSWTTDDVNLTTWTITGYISGTIDSSMNATDISPTASSVYQLTNTNFGSALAAGDVLQVKLNFTGSNGDDVRINKVTFTYNK